MGNTWAQESPKLQNQNQAHKLSKPTRAMKDAGPSPTLGTVALMNLSYTLHTVSKG